MRTLGVGLVCALLATGSAEARSRTSPRAGTPTGVADSPEHAAPIVADEATSPGCPLRIVPGKSFGPIRLSMSRGELDDLGVAHFPVSTELQNSMAGNAVMTPDFGT